MAGDTPRQLLQLPESLLVQIVSGLNGRSLAAMCCVCTELRGICSDDELWKTMCHRVWKYRQTELWRAAILTGEYRKVYGQKQQVRAESRSFES